MDKVTAILCNYEHHDYIEEAFFSLVNQTHENLDIIVVDDGSQTLPFEFVKRIDPKGRTVKYLQNDRNVGKWHCLNKAISQAEGDWIMVQDADDYAYPWKARVQLRALKQTQTLLNLAGYVPIKLNSEHTVLPTPDMNNITTIIGEEIMNCAIQSYHHPQINHNYTGKYDLHNGATMFHKSFHEIGHRFLPPHLGLRLAYSEDSDYNLRATLQFAKTSWTPMPCYSYRLGSGHIEVGL